jgi:putative transposase
MVVPRQARLDAPGTLHHVIVRGIEKRRIVDDQWDRRDFVSRMGQVASETETTVYAWALMTNHAHILLRSGGHGLSRFMRRFLTGYAITYNRRHRRHGHLFQNRYKSIVCDEDSYFRELVRYIHLNPVRAKVVKTISELDRYGWSGHSVLMGRIEHEWQDRDYVLSWFGSKEGEARRGYRQYVEDAVSQGRRSDLVGGGLVRSLGGWSEVLSMRRNNERLLTDERILGSGDFVEGIIREADHRLKHQFSGKNIREKADKLIEQTCKQNDINPKELRLGAKRGRIGRVRSQLAYQLVQDHGLPMAQVARLLGVSTSAICKAVSRREKREST